MLARTTSLPSRAASIHRFCRVVVTLSGVVAGAVVSGGSQWIAEHVFHDPNVQVSIFIAGIALPFAVSANYQTGAIAGLSDFAGLAKAAVAGAITLIAGASIGAWIAGTTGALVGLLLSLVVRASVGAIVLRARTTTSLMRTPDIGLRETWREIRHFAVPTLLSGLTAMLALWLSNAVLTSHAGAQAFGVFTSAFLIKTLVTFIPLQFGSVLLSRLSNLSARGDVDASRRTHTITVLMGAGIAFVLAAALVIGADHVMAVFGPGFEEGAPILRWLMLCAIFEATATLAFLSFPGRGKWMLGAAVYAVPKDFVLVIAALFLVDRFGAVGLAWAHTSSWLYGLVAIGVLNGLRMYRARVRN